MTPQERLDYLLEIEFVPVNRLVTIGMIREDIGLTDEQYRLVRGSLENAIATLKASDDPLIRQDGIDLQDALSAMLSGGTSISKANRQETIDRLAAFGKWPDELRDAVKGLGGKNQPRWQTEGYESEPTLEQVEKELVISATRSKITNIAAFLDTVDLSAYTVATLQSAIDSRMSSEDGTV